MQDSNEYIDLDFLKKLKGKSILLHLSSCEYKDELLQLFYDYIILNSKTFGLKGQAGKIRLAGGKVILMPFDNEYCIKLMIDTSLKISFFAGIQDGCCEGVNHECINSHTFFTRLSTLIGEDCLYLTNHLSMRRRPAENRLPFRFRKFKTEELSFNVSCLSEYDIHSDKWSLFKVTCLPANSVCYQIGRTEVHVHHASIWDCRETIDSRIIPHYPADVMRNYLPGFDPSKYLSHRQAVDKIFSWAAENRHETIAAIPFDSDKNLATGFLNRLYKGEDAYPKCIHFYHIKNHELQLFRERLRKDHTHMLLGTQSDRSRYKVLKEDLELGRGDSRIIPSLMLQFGPKALKSLSSGLWCLNIEMRFQCILALEKLGDPRAIKHLISMFDDPANAGMVYQLRETIGQLGGWNRMDPVYYALHNGSKETRYNMARVLSEYGDEKVLKHLISALKKKEVDIIAVCKALESWAISLHDRDSASAVLADCLLDEDPWIRSAAAMTLGTAGNLHSAKALINATRSNPEDEYLHYYAGESLAKIFEEYENDALKSELDALLTDNMFLGKEGILRVLNPEEFEHEGKYSKPDADSSAMSDRPDRVKQPAPENKGELEYSFAELGWEETHMVQPASGTFEELIEMLVSENPEVQLSALHALRKLGDLRITATFNKLLPKLTTFYHHEMAEVMGQLQDPRALPVLPEVFPMAWADLKMAIIRSLNRIGGRGAQKTLVIALNDKLPKVRYLAAWALGERISPASLNALKQALTAEKYNYVRKQIEASIENYKGLKTTENPTV